MLSQHFSDERDLCVWQESTGGAANAAATSRAGSIAGRYPATVGYLCPPATTDNFHTEPHRSAHAGFYACVGAFCRSRHFFAVGCRSPPPFVLEGISTRTERKERSMSREKNNFEKFPQKWPKGVVVVKKSRHEKYLFLLCFFKSRHEEHFCGNCFFKSGHGQ